MSGPERAGAILTIDTGAVAANWALLKGKLKAGCECAAVVKADAYGLGVARIAPALAERGCRTFFVATIDEGIELRSLLPSAVIYILNGPGPGTVGDFEEHDLRPVLNEPGQVALWGRRTGCALHVDTGMSRLGLTNKEVERLDRDFRPSLLMSHMACAEEAKNPMNGKQISAFAALREKFAPIKGSLANSSGILLGEAAHFDMARPGAALYGVNPNQPPIRNPMAQAVRLQGRIVQVRDAAEGETVGYGATYTLAKPGRIATVAVGYADGYLRSLSNRATGFMGEREVRLIGRVSMDLITFDVTDVPEAEAHPGAMIDLIGPHNPVDILAAKADTIGYEILTSLGRRYFRRYV